MRNRWGIEIKRGYYAWAHHPTAGSAEGRIVRIVGKSDDAYVVFDSGQSVMINDIQKVLPPFHRAFRETVERNSTGNRWGVEVKRGYYAWAHHPRGGNIEGRIARVVRERGGSYVVFESGQTATLDDVYQVLPPLRRARGGVVKANPLSRVAIDSPSQRERVTERGTTTKRPSARLIERRIKTASTTHKGVYANPLKRVKVTSPSMATKAAPSARLVKRRQRTARAPAGFYANPLTVQERSGKQRSLVYSVTHTVLVYHGKTRPSGKPDLVIPARDYKHAKAIVEALRANGAEGVAIIDRMTNLAR